MTKRITKEILRTKVDNINTVHGLNLTLEYAYGGVRLCKQCENGGLSDISVRVTNSEMADILDAIDMTIHKFGLKI